MVAHSCFITFLQKTHPEHYTQLMWAKSTHVGCAAISYQRVKEYDDLKRRYVRSYYCAYGPGGNLVGELPYVANLRRPAGFCRQPISV